MKRITIIIASLLLTSWSAAAQGFESGGAVVDPSTITAFDLFNASQSQFSFGSARSAAMAGAFTSLGGDMASMAINPAGLGMYKKSEVTITPMMTFSRSSTSAAEFEGNASNRFALGGVGLIFKLRESERGVTAITLGLGYTRTADFNYQYSFATRGRAGGASIADLFAGTLQSSGVSVDYLRQNYDHEGYFKWQNIDPTYWGATLGYLTGLTGSKDGVWGRDMIAPTAEVDQFTTIESRGSAGEYDISLGLNINNRLYIGATLGIPVLSVQRDIYYGESYHYSSEPALDYRMDLFNYDQRSRIKGVGVNFKLGVIYAPIEGLRLGVAIHTPTYYSLTYKYAGGMTSDVKALNNKDDYQTDADGYLNPPLSEQTSTLVDDGNYGWKYTTPTRLLFGASYSFLKRYTLSIDYERDWYNGMRIKHSPYGKGLYDGYMKERFKGSNTLRVGVEARIIPQVAVRAGYGLWSGALHDTDRIYSSPVIYRTDYAGAGVGVALSKYFTIDVAYQYYHNRMTPYKTFFATDSNGLDVASATYRTTIDRHAAIVTLGVRF